MTARFEGRTTRAAVLREPGRPLEIEELEIAEPGPGEVLVRIAASGVCHSDFHVLKGEWAQVPRPIVLGHEGAGWVEAVGPGVERTVPGDRALLSWLPSCERCRYCRAGRPQLCLGAEESAHKSVMFDGGSRLRRGDERIYSFMTLGSFGERTVVPESAVVPVESEVPLDLAAVVGCAVATGFGAASKTAPVPAGASAVVIGCGGVGLSVVQGCLAQSANPLIAVDANPAKLAVATELGATHAVDASREDPVAAVNEITGGLGADFAFEAIGLRETLEQAVAMLAPGGSAVLVGMPPDGVAMELDPNAVVGGELRILGCNYGSCNPPLDFPKLLGLYRSGRLDLESLVTRRLALEQVNEAFAAMARGEGVRNLIVYEEGAG